MSANQLTPDQLWKDPRVSGVTSNQSPRFAAHSVEPFESPPLHPHRSPFFLAGKEVNRGANTQGNFCPQLVTMLMDPDFLFGGT